MPTLIIRYYKLGINSHILKLSCMWLLSLIAFLGFVSSLVVHISTFRNVDPQQTLPLAWLLFLGVFVVFGYFISLSTPSLEERGQNWHKKTITMPLTQNWIGVVFLCFFVYGLVNFVLCSFLSFRSVGGLVDRNEKYAIQLQNYHFVTRKLTKEEQYRQKVYTVRLMSGHEMCFYLFFGLSFWLTKSELELDN